MKCSLAISLAIWTTTFGLVGLAPAAPVNGSFESGTFYGWQIQIPRGRPKYQSRFFDAGTMDVATSWGYGARPAQLGAKDGSHFAVIGSRADANFVGDQLYNISLNQQFSLNAAETVSGWAAFFAGAAESHDYAWVRVLDGVGQLVATPWQKSSSNTGNSSPHSPPPAWTQWSWEAPTSGIYTLSLGLTTRDDNQSPSYGFFDDIFTIPPALPVPEPTVLTLVVAGAALLASRRRSVN